MIYLTNFYNVLRYKSIYLHKIKYYDYEIKN